MAQKSGTSWRSSRTNSQFGRLTTVCSREMMVGPGPAVSSGMCAYPTTRLLPAAWKAVNFLSESVTAKESVWTGPGGDVRIGSAVKYLLFHPVSAVRDTDLTWFTKMRGTHSSLRSRSGG